MKLGRLAVVFAAAAFIAAIPLSNMVLANQEGKVDICHFPDGKEEGIVISVSAAALDTHITMHGDLTKFEVPKGGGNKCIRTCKIQACKKGEVFDKKLCRCVPGDGCGKEQECGKGQVWDPKKCQCVPDDGCGKEQECGKGEIWDPNKCQCVPSKG